MCAEPIEQWMDGYLTSIPWPTDPSTSASTLPLPKHYQSLNLFFHPATIYLSTE